MLYLVADVQNAQYQHICKKDLLKEKAFSIWEYKKQKSTTGTIFC